MRCTSGFAAAPLPATASLIVRVPYSKSGTPAAAIAARITPRASPRTSAERAFADDEHLLDRGAVRRVVADHLAERRVQAGEPRGERAPARERERPVRDVPDAPALALDHPVARDVRAGVDPEYPHRPPWTGTVAFRLTYARRAISSSEMSKLA